MVEVGIRGDSLTQFSHHNVISSGMRPIVILILTNIQLYIQTWHGDSDNWWYHVTIIMETNFYKIQLPSNPVWCDGNNRCCNFWCFTVTFLIIISTIYYIPTIYKISTILLQSEGDNIFLKMLVPLATNFQQALNL